MKLKTVLAVSALLFTVSCGAYYRMITVLDKNGNVQREIYAHGNKERTTDLFTKNPFLFEVDTTWTMHCLDSIIRYNFFGEEKELNVKINKQTKYIEQFTQDIYSHKNERSLAVPEEFLLIKRGLLFTRYLFKAKYHKFEYHPPVSVDNYLSKEEQMLWTQGDMSSYNLMNGSEMSDYLNNIKSKFMRWYGRNLFEVSLKCINKLNDKYDLDKDKEKIYKQVIDLRDDDLTKIDPGFICNVLDSHYRTTYFSKLYKINNLILDDDFDRAVAIEAQVPDVVSYELVISGNILQTNAPIVNADTLIWKVDGMRLLFDDFILTAEYRTLNRLALWIIGLLILVVVCGSAVLLRKGLR
jgi:hypothetical protein